jgi:4-amino-4-deoxy-L-arabinose transferase-like glycosyltransferase
VVDSLDQLAPVASDPKDPPGTTARAGSIDVTRGGPVMIGFQSDTDARLTVLGMDLRGHGVTTPWNGQPPGCMGFPPTPRTRVVVPHGPLAIRFAAPPGARLVWSPVGRRGDPEYVPASSLSPDPPDTATFDSPGANVSDGLIALAILALVVAFVLQLARVRIAGVPRDVWLAIAGVFAIAAFVRWIAPSFGLAWDEDVNWASGRNYVSNLLSLDFHARDWQWNCEHPPVMKYIDGIGAQLADGYGPARWLSGLMGALGCALMVPIGCRLFSLRAGMIAGVIAALLPPLVAHGQIVGHESPSVLWWALAILLALGVHDESPSTRTLILRLVGVGVAIGIAVASRFVNGLVGPVCLVIVIARAPRGRILDALGWGSIVMPPVSVATVYALWPRLWLHPIAALEASFAKLNTVHASEPFLGHVTDKPPLYYFALYLFATLPIGVLAAVITGVVRGARERSVSWLVMLAWLVIPLAVMASPVKQDGVRYVLPCVMALAMIAGAGLDGLRRHANIAVVLAVYLAIVDVQTYPYYLDYFGEQVGTASTVQAHRWFETAWWGEGLDRALAYVDANAPPNAKVFRCVEPAHLAWFREDLWAPVDKPQDATWWVWYAPRSTGCPIPKDAHLVYQVENRGLVLAEVWMK